MNQKDQRQALVDTFINSIYLYDDKVLITFNYKEGTQTIPFEKVEESKAKGNGSDFDCVTAPRKTSTQCVLVFLFRCGRGLEQHGPTAGGATKAPVGLLLVRGFQPVGMSTGRQTVYCLFCFTRQFPFSSNRG